ncbi:hypothetical protein [Nocardia brasiliensis]|uniref:hypothetical protein n=1 Tax=Nocardia brasiliensis TaxID=37326 RepID=UPI0033EE7C68
MKLVRKSVSASLILFASGAIALVTPHTAAAQPPMWETGSVAVLAAGSCVASENLQAIADNFIASCRKGSIRREFPGQMLNLSLKDIKSGNSAEHKKAWKLLNDNRFKK